MNRILIAVLLALGLSVGTVHAQIKALTDDGKEVILFGDNTWQYTNEEDNNSEIVQLERIVVDKPESASFLVKGNQVPYGIWIDPKKWRFSKSADTEETEYTFDFRAGDAYAMVIAEETEIPVDNLKQMAFQNALAEAPDAKITKQGDRVVNGVDMSYMEIEGTMQGIEFVFLANYYSDENGSIQVVGYTSQQLLEKYRQPIDDLINGFTNSP